MLRHSVADTPFVCFNAVQEDALKQLLVRRRDAAEALGVSESQLLKWERAGLIEPVNLEHADDAVAIRAVRYRVADVEALAERLLQPAR